MDTNRDKPFLTDIKDEEHADELRTLIEALGEGEQKMASR